MLPFRRCIQDFVHAVSQGVFAKPIKHVDYFNWRCKKVEKLINLHTKSRASKCNYNKDGENDERFEIHFGSTMNIIRKQYISFIAYECLFSIKETRDELKKFEKLSSFFINKYDTIFYWQNTESINLHEKKTT